MIVSVAFPDQYYLWVKVTYIILMFSPLSNATCCTYKHGLVNVTRNVSLSSVPANDLLSCEQKKKWKMDTAHHFSKQPREDFQKLLLQSFHKKWFIVYSC